MVPLLVQRPIFLHSLVVRDIFLLTKQEVSLVVYVPGQDNKVQKGLLELT